MLEQHIKDLIKKDGAMTVGQYMSIALTDEKHGYYRSSKPIGREGDFITAPEISQLFGELIGVWLVTCWKEMGSPEAILVEPGPGKGTLMSDILRATANVEGFHENLSIHMIDINAELMKTQKEILKDYKVKWHADLSNLPEKPLLLVANEFFDALPVFQLIQTKDGIREQLVALDDNDNLIFKTSSEKTLNCKLLPKSLNNLEGGDVYEVSPQSIEAIKLIAKHIATHNGAALIIDYGYYNNGLIDTLQAVKNHQFHEFLKSPGQADLTAHVNFTRLGKEAEKVGARVQGNITQGKFLQNMGIELRAEMLSRHSDEETRGKIRSQLQRLIDNEEMGTLFKCMAITNNNSSGAFGFA